MFAMAAFDPICSRVLCGIDPHGYERLERCAMRTCSVVVLCVGHKTFITGRLLMIHLSRMLFMAWAGCLWIGMAAATPKAPPEITKLESSIIEIEVLRLGNDYISYKLGIYSDGTVRFLGKPDKSQVRMGVGEHYARIPLADLQALRNVLKQVNEKQLSEFRKTRKAQEVMKMTPPTLTPETPPPIIPQEPPAITMERFFVDNAGLADKVNIYADGTMEFDNSRQKMGHQYSRINPEEVRMLKRAFELVQPAIIPRPPEITKREYPVITLEDLAVGDMYVRHKVEIYGDGTIHYYGEPGGKYGAIGDHYLRMSRAKLEELLREFKVVEVVGEDQKLDFFDLEDDYTKYTRVHDARSSAITLYLDGRSKRVEFYGHIAELEGRIWRAVDLNQWMCVPPHKGCFTNLESK
jgi:hypothetical protein